MPKWLKTVAAVLLLPVCWGAALALARLVDASGDADTTWVPFLAGAVCWITIYVLLPKPMWLYVFGHELTHAVWAWAFGSRVKRFKAAATGGHVILTRSNFLIALAPYFFPLYAAIIIAVFCAGTLIWEWGNYRVWFHLLLGAAYAFHVTLTWHVLKTRQTDITEQGYLFSAVIIFLGNILVLLLGIPLLAGRVTLAQSFGWWFEYTRSFFRHLPGWF